MILHGDAFEMLKTLPDCSVQTCVTSPPYWGLRDYGVEGQLGLEKTPEEYVANMVKVFREVKRVLRDDGTLWLNLGDSYNGSGGPTTTTNFGRNADGVTGEFSCQPRHIQTLKPKDLVGIPWRVAFALQADGWYLRQDIIWSKPNPMPESVTDRCTKAHEYIFLLTKSARYYYDNEAVKEALSEATVSDGRYNRSGESETPYGQSNGKAQGLGRGPRTDGSGKRNLRSVWTITTKPYKGAHFATFPPEIPERCIKAGTSEKGCCEKCGSPVERVLEKVSTGVRYSTGKSKEKNDAGLVTGFSGYDDGSSSPTYETIGWQPTCDCKADTVPCVVLDPFGGAGTTAEVAKRLGRKFIIIELNEKYIKDHIEPRVENIDPLFSEVG